MVEVMANADRLTTTKLHPTIGVEVIGLDASVPTDPETLAAIVRLSAEAKLLLFRDQSLSGLALNAFAKQFGNTNQEPPPNSRRRREHEVSLLGSNPDGSKAGDGYALVARFWHTDSSWRAIPTYLSFLYCAAKPDIGGNTCFADMVASYEALPRDRKSLLDGKSMVHSYAFLRRYEPSIPLLGDDAPPPATHPLVRTFNARKSLFLNGHVAYYVGNMPFAEGQVLFGELMEHATAPQFVYEHQWAVGDLLVWDNRTTMHRATPYDRSQPRLMYRAEVTCTDPPQ